MPKRGYKQSAAHKAKKAKLVTGKKNGRWKGGRHYTTYRKLAGAKKGDSSVIHHINGVRSDNRKSNLRKLTDGKKKPGRRTTPLHEALTKRRSKR
jgi:hypothetical protein